MPHITPAKLSTTIVLHFEITVEDLNITNQYNRDIKSLCGAINKSYRLLTKNNLKKFLDKYVYLIRYNEQTIKIY